MGDPFQTAQRFEIAVGPIVIRDCDTKLQLPFRLPCTTRARDYEIHTLDPSQLVPGPSIQNL